MKTIFLISSLLLTGCTTTKTLEVKAPCPKPNIPTRPHLPIEDLKQDDSAPIVMKSYVASLGMCIDSYNSLEHQMRGN